MSTKSTIKPEVMMNKVSQIPIGTLAGYKPEQLHDLLAEARKELERAKTTKQWIEAAIALKYQEKIQAKRLRLEKDSGIIHLEDEDFKISCDVVKKVEWDQEALAKVAERIALGGGIVSNYMQTYYKISERDYKNWPAGVQTFFVQARSIRLGNPTYELVQLGQEVVYE
jgi:hypothetical protein